MREGRKLLKKVAILGYTAHRDKAPFNDNEFEIWGLNDLYKHNLPRFTRWFQLHTKKIVDDTNREDRTKWEELVKDYAQMQCPVYTTEAIDIPNNIVFPLEEIQAFIKERFPYRDFNGFFTNSISYMIALAIHEGFQEIHVYGVDMAVGSSEYGHQRPSCEFWLGVAAGLGITIHIPQESDLLTSMFMYGYEEEKRTVLEAKWNQVYGDIENKKQQAIAEELRLRDWKNQLIGAQEGIKELKDRWMIKG